MPLERGQLIHDRYRIVKLLGQGGFGAVYRAWDVSLERPCALKENLDTSQEAQRQFKREAVILANLSHPNLPHVIDHFILPGQGQYLVMEFVDGEDLQSMLESKGGPLDVLQILPWVGQICDALSYLHSQNPPIIHRDIKPANIKITPAGKAVLVDFGIAKIFDPQLRTTIGARAVTPGFSPPEQYGQGTTDARSDIYALGATLYALFTGQAPPDGVDIMSGNAPQPSPPHTINPAVSTTVSEAVARAMQVSRTGRFGSVRELKEALGEAVVPPSRKVGETREAIPAEPVTMVAPYPSVQVSADYPPAPAAEPVARTMVAPQARPVAASAAPKAAKKRTPWWIWIGIAAILGLAAILVGTLLLSGIGGVKPTGTPTILAEKISPTFTKQIGITPAKPTEIRVGEPQKATDTPAHVSVVEPPKPVFLACQVTDVGGIDDNSFNAITWKGVQLAMAKLGIGGKFLESKQQSDYGTNIDTFLQEGCNIIVTTGWTFSEITKSYAQKFPDRMFTIVDSSYDPPLPNVLGQQYETQEAAFLAGYLAAGVSKTGVVGTFGGMQIPSVTAFMDGYALGVQYYNKLHGGNVQVVGWDPTSQSGLFSGNFTNTDDGLTMGKLLVDKGADIIFPVAGPVGLGTASLARDFGKVYVIGVDTDWFLTAPDFRNVFLTSVMKNVDVATYGAIEAAFLGNFKGGVYIGSLANNGVGLAPFHELEKVVPPELSAELEKIKGMIINGEIQTKP
jgi:basic membrane protein A